MKKDQKAIIIGAGIAGIATALRLTKQGYRVSVYEGNSYPGGKLSQLEMKGFRFDAGPSLFTMPQYVEELFQLFGKNTQEHFEYDRLPIVCRYFYPDGQVLDTPADAMDFKRVLVEELGEEATKVEQFFQQAARLYEITEPVFLRHSIHKLSTYLKPQTLKSFLRLHQLDVFRTMHQANAALFKNPKTIQLFDRYATYNGSNPYEAPATLNIISHLEHDIGAFFPKKGMYSITESLVALSEEVGVEFHYNQRVDEILLDKGKAVGVKVNGEHKPASVVVSNMDVANTYKRLLPTAKHPKFILSQPKSSSALIFYWGIDRVFAELDVHNILFTEDYQREFKTMFEDQSIDDDPTVYIFISSKAVPKDAPEGCENWFVMINVPNNQGQDWDELIQQARRAILAKIRRHLGVDMAPRIICEEYLDPRRIESKTASVAGALYGNSSNNKFAAFLRHPNFSRRIKDLYFCGGSVHPGGGIPLCLLSARITAEAVAE